MRLYTLEEANALLPEIIRLFDQIDQSREVMRQMEPEVKRAAQHPGGGGTANGFKYARALTDFMGGAQQILSYGLEIKDFERGLCDFPHERDGRIVYLCWQRGEETIEWWHDIDAGFAGRTLL